MSTTRGDIIEHGGGGAVAPKPKWLRKRLEWFMDQRFGIFFHWGPYCQWDCCESWPLVPEDTWARPDGMRCWEERGRDLARFQRDYWALNRTFNPVEFDPAAWASAARAGGMKYVTFTTKHHDGFCMWDTRTTDYRVTHPDCPFHEHPKADIARHVFDAFRQEGLGVSCYFSKSDWHSPHYWSPRWPPVHRNPNYDTAEHPEIWDGFVRFVHGQVEELMTGYGPIDALWLDGGQVRADNKQDIRMAEMAAMARRHQPGLIMADRTVGGDYEDFITPEHTIPEEPLGVPWESCLTLGHAWKYVEHDQYRPARDVIRMLAEVASKGGNLLLGFGPDPLGRLPQEAVARLREVGAWLEVNGEAIYGTREVAPYGSGDVRFTARGSTTYAIVLKVSDEAWARSEAAVPALRPAPGSKVHLLGHAAPPAWRAVGDGFTVELPDGLDREAPAWVVRFERG